MASFDYKLLGAMKCLYALGDSNRTMPFNRYMDVSTAKEIFSVSDSTVRNALKRLETQGEIRRVRGEGGVNNFGRNYWFPVERIGPVKWQNFD